MSERDIYVCQLYRVRWISHEGYVVYRAMNRDHNTDESVMIHKEAVFVQEDAATLYATFRNMLTILRGSDKIGL